MVEIRLQRRITKTDVQRVGVVRDRHELGCGRLGRSAAVENTEIGVVGYVIPDHHGRSPVQHLAVVDLSVCLVVSVGRDEGKACLSVDLVFLVLEIDSCALVVVLVQDVAGVGEIERLPDKVVDLRIRVSAAVVGVFRRLVPVPAVAVVGGNIETVPQWLGIDESAR